MANADKAKAHTDAPKTGEDAAHKAGAGIVAAAQEAYAPKTVPKAAAPTEAAKPTGEAQPSRSDKPATSEGSRGTTPAGTDRAPTRKEASQPAEGTQDGSSAKPAVKDSAKEAATPKAGDAGRDGKTEKPSNTDDAKITADSAKRDELTVSAISDAVKVGDEHKMEVLLAEKSHVERERLAALYEKTTHRSLLSDVASKFAPMGSKLPHDFQAAERVSYLITRPDHGSASADRLDLLLYGASHGNDGAAVEKRIRDTVHIMSPSQIKEKLGSRTTDGSGPKSLLDRLLTPGVLSDETREMLSIYTNGHRTDKGHRTPEDTRDLAGIALKYHDKEAFREVMSDASVEGRLAFAKEGPLQKELSEEAELFRKTQATFAPDAPSAKMRPGELAVERFLAGDKDSIDSIVLGKISTAELIRKNVGMFSSNIDAMESVTSMMSPREIQMYTRGRELASQPVPPKDSDDYTYYEAVHKQFVRAGGSVDFGGAKEATVARLEEPILYAGSTLLGRMADHAGVAARGSMSGMTDELRHLTEPGHETELAFLKGKVGPDGKVEKSDFRKRVDEILEKSLREPDAAKLKEYLDKLSSGDKAAALPEPSLVEKLSKSHSQQDVLYTLAHMSREDAARYKHGRELAAKDSAMTAQEKEDFLFAKNVDAIVKDTSHPSVNGWKVSVGDGRRAALQMLAAAERGELPDATVAKATLPEPDPTGPKPSPEAAARKTVSTLEVALADPKSELRAKLDDTTHPEYSRQFEANLRSQLSPEQYKRYVEPLLAGKPISLEDRVSLYSSSEPGRLIHDLGARSKEERQAAIDALSDKGADTPLGKALRDRLPEDHRTLLSKELSDLNKDEKVALAEKMQELILGLTDADSFRKEIAAASPQEKERAQSQYASDYGHIFVADLMDKLPDSAARREIEEIATDHYNDSDSSYQRMLASVQRNFGDGFGNWFVTAFGDGTPAIAGEARDAFAKAMQHAAELAREMPPEMRKKYEDQLRTTLTNLAKSKERTADFVIGTGIAALSVFSAPISGGFRLGEMIFTAGVAGSSGAALKEKIMGPDGSGKQFVLDAFAFSADAYFGMFGAGQVAKLASIGREQGFEAASAVLGEMKKTSPELAGIIQQAGGEQKIADSVAKAVQHAIVSRHGEVSHEELLQLSQELVGKGKEAELLAKAIETRMQPELQKAATRWLTRHALLTGAATTGGTVEGFISGLTHGEGLVKAGSDALLAGLTSGAFAGVIGAGFGIYASTRSGRFGSILQSEVTNSSSFYQPGPVMSPGSAFAAPPAVSPQDPDSQYST